MSMNGPINLNKRRESALLGMFIGDALAMPVHWYYNTSLLRRDYGIVEHYLRPKNPHPDSILWRSSYSPVNAQADILHDQAIYWGQKDIHYHQFLEPGENTLNLKLAAELLKLMAENGGYSSADWLKRMINFMTTPGKHNDTYVEEYLRHFFSNYGRGIEHHLCGRNDEKHIGGLSQMLPLLIAMSETHGIDSIAVEHLSLTHGGRVMAESGEIVAGIILRSLRGESTCQAISNGSKGSPYDAERLMLESLTEYDDEIVIGRHFSSACYMQHALPAILYLALKYHDDPRQALIANTMCGGDNAGRGAVLGAILGASGGPEIWPEKWRQGLNHHALGAIEATMGVLEQGGKSA